MLQCKFLNKTGAMLRKKLCQRYNITSKLPRNTKTESLHRMRRTVRVNIM